MRTNSYSRRELEMARRAAGSESVLDLDELRSCGFSQWAVRRRARQGRLHRIYEGVYAVGHPNISLKGRFIAATKACKPFGALSHRATGAYLEIRKWTERDIEITVPRGVTREHPGIQLHRSTFITRADQMVRDGMLMTNATWTVVALAGVLPANELRAAVREALGLKIVSPRGILALLDRLGPVRGARTLKEILARSAPTRSEFEDVVYDLIACGGFALPEVNQPLRLEGRTIVPDFRWPDQRLVIEADSSRWHDDALSRADDLERQAVLERHGDTVLRVRWDEAILRPRAARDRLAAAGAPFD